MILHDTVTRQRATTVSDGYGNQAADWANPDSADYPASVQPMTNDEDVVDQNRTVTRWRLFLDPTADVTATDRIEWDGDVYEVDGDIERWKRRGRLHHLQAVLMKVTQR